MSMTAVLRLVRLLILIGRFDAMYKQTMSAAVAAIGTKAMSGSHRKAAHMKKNASRAIHTVGSLIGDMEKMLR